jgi:hypothetical protein
MTASKNAGRLSGVAALCATLLTVLLPAAPALADTTVRASTGGVSHLKGTSGQLNGEVVTTIPVNVFFEYGPNGAPLPYASKTKPLPISPPQATNGRVKAVKVGQIVTGLLPKYHYRIAATYVLNGETKTVYGKDKSFGGGALNKLKFDIPKSKEEPLTATYGEPFELTGSLTGAGNANHGMVLQQTPFPYTETFTTLPGTVFSSRTGSFVFRLARMTQNTQFRILTTDPRPLYSPAMIVHVTPRITLHVRSAGKTGLYRLYGTVSPARNGALITIQKLTPRKAISKRSGPAAHSVRTTILKRATSTLSRFSIVVSLTGSYRYRAFVKLPKGKLDSGHSANVLIKAPKALPGKTPKRKK